MQRQLTSGGSLNIEDMWQFVNKEDKAWGIDGYVVPRKYHRSPKIQKTKILDKDGKPIKFQRKDFLDEVVRWSQSYYSKDRAEKVKEYYDSHGRSLEEFKLKLPDTKVKEKCKLYRHDREFFTIELGRIEKKNRDYYPEKKDAIEELRKKLEEEQKARENETSVAKMKIKYKNKGSLPFILNIGKEIK